jgi:biopolymer transport protein ExbD
MNRLSRIKFYHDPPKVDLNPFVDMAFQLIIFFMLTTSFKIEEPAIVNIPSSTSEIKLPDKDIIIISLDKEGKVYFDIDGKFTRERLIKNINAKFKLDLQEEDIKKFSLLRGFGVPFEQLKGFLRSKEADRKKFIQTGIPYDQQKNELHAWIVMARIANPKARFAIKADKDVLYPQLKPIIETLRSNNINRFNLLTELKRYEIKK